MNKSVIAVKNSEGKLPQEFIHIAATECDGALGFAMAKSDGTVFTMGTPASPEEAEEMTKETQNDVQCADKKAVFFYQKTDGTQSKDDYQPFTVLRDSKQQPIMVAFFDADELEDEFNELHNSSPQKHTPEFFAAHTYLVGKVSEIYQRTKDLNETIKELKQPSTYKEIVKSLRKDKTSRFVVTFVAGNDDIFSIAQNEKERSFNWGYVSQAFAYDETPKEVVAPKATKSLLGGGTTQPTSVPTVVPSVVPSVVEGDKLNPDDHKDTLFVPPEHITSRGARKDWYKAYGHSGVMNEIAKKEFVQQHGQWQEGKAPIKLNINSLKKVEELLNAKKIARWSDATRPVASTKPITTDVKGDPAPAVIINTAPDKAPPISMILKPEARQKLEVLLPRIIASRDDKGQLIIDPTKLGEYEKSVPTITEQLGKSDISLIPMSPEQVDIVVANMDANETLSFLKRMVFQMQGLYFAEKTLRETRDDELNKLKNKPKSAFAA